VLSQGHHNEGLRLLVVEDSKRVADRLFELLDQVPQVETIGAVESEREAIASVRSTDPDVVILDLHLKQSSDPRLGSPTMRRCGAWRALEESGAGGYPYRSLSAPPRACPTSRR